MTKLQLALKAEYFDAIKAGTKPEEYRLANTYWTKRLNYDGKSHMWPRSFSSIVLTKGYPKAGDPERTLELPWRGFTRKTITHPHFGPDPVDVFAIDVRYPPPPVSISVGVWLPIERADKSTDRIYDFPGMPRPIGNSEEYWCRDTDGRVFLATWADDGKRAYWWDLDGESPVDPVEFMPHPLDPRFHTDAKMEDKP